MSSSKCIPILQKRKLRLRERGLSAAGRNSAIGLQISTKDRAVTINTFSCDHLFSSCMTFIGKQIYPMPVTLTFLERLINQVQKSRFLPCLGSKLSVPRTRLVSSLCREQTTQDRPLCRWFLYLESSPQDVAAAHPLTCSSLS